MHAGGGGGGGGGVDASSETVNVWPPIVTVPCRAAPVFTAIVSTTTAVPVPDPALVTVIHGELDWAVHAHALAVVSVTGTTAPAAVAVDDVGDSA